MLTRKKYEEELNESMQMYIDLMKKCWGEAPELEPKVEVVLKVSMDFDLGDFPHKGQSFIVEPGREEKMSPGKIAKRIVQEINSHRNACNRCGVPTPHLWTRQHGLGNHVQAGISRNWRTGMSYTENEIAMYDLPPDELERKLHPMLSSKLNKRLRQKEEAEKNSTEKINYKKEMDDWYGESVAQDV